MHQRNNIFYKLYTNKDGSLIGVDIISILMVGLKGHLSIKHFYLFIFSIFTYSACTTRNVIYCGCLTEYIKNVFRPILSRI
jgi:hypothetical protein